jgi:hypothetical protein
MFAISSAGSLLLDRIGASRAALAAPPGASTAKIRQIAAASPSTRVTLGKSDDGASVVYGDPRAKATAGLVWSSPVGTDDSVSALMARNRGLSSYKLADQWRGLGGALLNRFAQTGENYTQTMVDDQAFYSGVDLDALSPEEKTQRAADILAKQTADLAGVATNAPSAGLKIQTRSGQSVELKISVSAGTNDIVGMKVDLKASGAMTTKERTAIEQLANGLDRALEGLGRDDAVELDLSGLMGYDRDVIAGVDLTADNDAPAGWTLGSFSLHLDDDKRSIALKGSEGEINLNVDLNTQPANTPAQQRIAAMQSTLDRMDSAGDRGHAGRAVVKQMKSAFKLLQAATATEDDDSQAGKNVKPNALAEPATNATTDAATRTASARALAVKPLSTTALHPVDAKAASQLSGLADFDASFGSDTYRTNRFGSANEASQSHYQLSQKTTTNNASNGGRSVVQTVSEQLSARILKASGPDAMLDVRNGDYSTTDIHDSSTVTTLIDAAANGATRVLRKTDKQQLKTLVDLENHRVVNRQSWPSERSWIERLQ